MNDPGGGSIIEMSRLMNTSSFNIAQVLQTHCYRSVLNVKLLPKAQPEIEAKISYSLKKKKNNIISVKVKSRLLE